MGKLVVLFVVLTAVLVNGQGWYATYQKPETGDFRSVQMLDSVTAIASGEKGIYRTSDGGKTWHLVEDRFIISGFSFIDKLNGYACGFQLSSVLGTIIKTTDGGMNWEIAVLHLGPSLRGIHFVDQSNGVAITDNGIIINTSDGGKNWEISEYISLYGLSNTFSFMDRNNGIAAGDELFKTTDSGLTWVSIYPRRVKCAAYAPNGPIFAAEEGKIYKSADSGKSWHVVHSEERLDILYLHFGDGNNGIALGEYGLSLLTTDGGRTWTRSYRGQNSLTSVSFADRFNGILTGSQGAVWRTKDGGREWEELQGSEEESLYSVSFTDELYGFACGGKGTILKTTDGGKRWKHIFGGLNTEYSYREYFKDLSDIEMTDRNHVYAIGCGMFTKTTNGGETWECNQLLEMEWECISDLNFIDNDNGWGAGIGGRIVRTTDGGESWAKMQSGTRKSLTSIAFADGYNGAAAGEGILLYTTDGGETWKEPEGQEPGEFALNYSSVCSMGNGEFAAAGRIGDSGSSGRSVILISQNGGGYWVRKYETSEILYSVQFSDSLHGNAAGEGGTILRTTDGGKNWHEMISNTDQVLYDIDFSNNRKGTAVGSRGTILLTDDGGGGTTGVGGEVDKVLDFRLEGNYPNPFNPATVIRYSAGSESGVRIAVYNSLGEEVRVLKDEVMQAGEYEVRFDGSGLSSGVYFYEMRTSDGIRQVKKMMLVK